MARDININGKFYSVEYDDRGNARLNGETLLDFVSKLSVVDTVWLIKNGISNLTRRPQFYADFTKKIELNHEKRFSLTEGK